MALREKFGRLVLLEETEVSALGRELRAARVGPSGLDRIVTVTCFAPAVSSHAAATKRLMDEARLAARLQNAGLVRVLGIGRVEQTFYVSTELVEGRTVAAIVERCARDSFPFAADHALMIASRAAAALEYLHSKKDDAGRILFHGLLAPSRVVVAFDGEVKLKGLGLWPALRDTGLLDEAQRARLAPEQKDGAAGDPRCDVYALALLLLESLAGSLPADPLAALPSARLTNAAGESLPLPKPLSDLLGRALARDPLARFGSIAEMRKAIDTLLFSGDFTPTTFDLAFFMHTLFREEMEREAREIEEARKADYREFVDDRSKPAAAAAAGPDASQVLMEPPLAAVLSEAPPPAPAASPAAPPAVRAEPVPSPAPLAEAAAEPSVVARESPRPARDAAHAREAAAKLTFGGVATARPPSRRGLWIALGVVGLLAVAGAGVLYVARRPAAATTTTTTQSPEAVAPLQRVKQLEDRIAQLERERAEAEAKAADEAKKKLESQAAAKGRTVDAAVLQRAQEEARARARAEQEKKQQDELARLAEQRKAEEKRIAEASPTPPSTTTTTAPAETVTATPGGAAPGANATEVATQPAPPAVVPTPAIAATPLVTEAVPEKEARIVPPMLLSQTPPRYPPIAQQRGIEGIVELTALVDETGHVAEVRVTRTQPAKIGFEEAAMQHVRTRRYKPATRDGTPIRMVVPIVVKFTKSR